MLGFAFPRLVQEANPLQRPGDSDFAKQATRLATMIARKKKFVDPDHPLTDNPWTAVEHTGEDLADMLELLDPETTSGSYSPRTKVAASNAYKNFPRTGQMHVGDFYDDGNYFKVHLLDRDHPSIQSQIASKDQTTVAGRLASDPVELDAFMKAPHSLNTVSEYAFNWQSGHPDKGDTYTQHRDSHPSIAHAVQANGGEGYGSFGGSKRGAALNDMLKSGEIAI